jgi:hypothetical protein
LIRAAVLAALLLGGCGTDSGVQVTVTSTGIVPAVDELQATVGHDGQSQTVSLVVSGAAMDISAAAPQIFTLLFDPSLSGDVSVQVTALEMSVPLAAAPTVTVAIVPGEVVPVAVALPGQGGGDMGREDLTSVNDFSVLPDFMPSADLAEAGMTDDAGDAGATDDGGPGDGAATDGGAD